MQPAILSIGKSLPIYSLSQIEIAEQISDLMNLDDKSAKMVKKIYKNSSIERRYSVLSEIIQPKGISSSRIGFLGMSERNSIYKKEAPLLAEKAAKHALDEWQRPVSEITHVISVSCTGIMTPGVEFILADRFGLDPHTSLLGINFMGCHGAFKALKMAANIALANSKNRILVVCTELCSLHFKASQEIEKVVIESLFADGSAAVIIGSEPKENEKSIFWIEGGRSYAIRGTMNEMAWEASNLGFDMILSRKVPSFIGAHIESFAKGLLGTSMEFHECEWAIHPGGKSIIKTVENALSLDRASTQSAWNVLNSVGNISSATFLFVLYDIYQRKISNKRIACLGFGPGLSVEGLLLSTLDKSP